MATEQGPTGSGAGDAYVLGAWPAAALVFGSSAAVLVVELVALRLLAPHFGLTLETSTLVIGLALTAIAAGTWAGGGTADRVPPRRLLAPLLGISGAAVALTPVVVRGSAASSSPGLLLLAATLSILVPGALLSAVSPVVIKLRLTSLRETGTVVGHLSGIGTVGAIAGTVLTGFVLISRVPVSGILVGLGVLLLATSVLVRVSQGRPGRGEAVLGAVVALAGLGAATAPSGCDTETTYHCLAVDADPDRPSGRTLVLDGLRHSYVDVADPTHLDFEYVQAMASVVDTAFAPGERVDAYYLGAGGLTLPRYVAATRPGSANEVSEIDRGVVEADVELLGDAFPERTQVRVEDGRLAIDDLAPASVDLVVGDAFGGVSVPWHLATEEALGGLAEALSTDGVYVANVIDNGPLDFARAYVRTTAEVFAEVTLLAVPALLAGENGGNMVVVASDEPVDVAAAVERMAERDLGWSALGGEELHAWAGDAPVLTDDFAPVDQLLTPYGR